MGVPMSLHLSKRSAKGATPSGWKPCPSKVRALTGPGLRMDLGRTVSWLRKLRMDVPGSWWLNHPFEKDALVKLDHFPK